MVNNLIGKEQLSTYQGSLPRFRPYQYYCVNFLILVNNDFRVVLSKHLIKKYKIQNDN